MNIDTLTKDGFVSIEYPTTLREHVEAAMDSWKGFCDLPQKNKQALLNGDRLNDFGYMRRADKSARADNKELFHVSKKDVPQLRECAEHVTDERAVAFIDAIDTLITESAPLIQNFANEVERRYGLAGFEDDVMRAKDRWTFRYLHYLGGNDVLAHPHADRGGFTLHLYETHPGGEYFGFDRTWQPWPVSAERTIIFPSMELQYRSENALKALWHRVLANGSPVDQTRYAMVAFIDFAHDFRYNDRKQRLQDFEPGFNYDLPFSDFQRFFVKR